MTIMNDHLPGKRVHRVRLLALPVVLAFVAAPLVSSMDSASADNSTPYVDFTTIGIYPRSEPDMAAAHVGAALTDGTPLGIECELEGAAVDNGSGPSVIWEKLQDGTYIPNAYVQTGSDTWTSGIPRCDTDKRPDAVMPARLYNRQASEIYARAHVNDVGRLPASPDCTWFASEVLWAGGLPKTEDWTDHTTDPSKSVSRAWAWLDLPTKAAMSADVLKGYLTSSGLATARQISLDDLIISDAEVGDLIFYDWENSSSDPVPDDVMDHVAIVTKNDGTQTVVAQHTPAEMDKGWNWSADAADWLRQSRPPARAYLLHITY